MQSTFSLSIVFLLLVAGAALPLEAAEPFLTPPPPFLFSQVESRSISPGNPTGAKGGAYRGVIHSPKAGDEPGDDFTKHDVTIPAGKTFTMADIKGPGMVRSIWLTIRRRRPEDLRSCVIRIFWDDSEVPSVECPLGDFFGLSHGRAAHFATPYLGTSEGKGYHCHFPMPFASRCRITLENDSSENLRDCFYSASRASRSNLGK